MRLDEIHRHPDYSSLKDLQIKAQEGDKTAISMIADMERTSKEKAQTDGGKYAYYKDLESGEIYGFKGYAKSDAQFINNCFNRYNKHCKATPGCGFQVHATFKGGLTPISKEEYAAKRGKFTEI